MKRFVIAIAALMMAATLTACEDDAMVASRNLSKAADMFEIDHRQSGRRVVFILLRGRSCEDQAPAKAQLDVSTR